MRGSDHPELRPAVLDVIDLATHYRSMELKIEELPVSGGFGSGQTLGSSGLHRHAGAIVIGIVAGLYPAIVASRMTPIEALIHE